MRHLFWSSTQVVEELAKLSLGPGCYFALFDIKDFYTKGSITQLLNNVARDRNLQSDDPLVSVLEFLLEEQFICSAWAPGRVYKSTCGSGQGLAHSGELADINFWTMCEKNFACSVAMQQRCGVRFYGRYRDDGLIIFEPGPDGSRDGPRQFGKGLIERAGFYKIIFTQIGKEVEYLDLVLKIKDVKVIAGPFYKHQTIPLEGSSGHHPTVHARWPYAVLKVFKIHCGKSLEELAMRDNAISAFRSRFFSNFLTFPPPQIKTLEPSFKANCWLVLPFHPKWFINLKRVITKFSQDPFYAGLLKASFDDARSRIPCVNVAWANTLPSHRDMVRQASSPSKLVS
jgi:hypothetical protein